MNALVVACAGLIAFSASTAMQVFPALTYCEEWGCWSDYYQHPDDGIPEDILDCISISLEFDDATWEDGACECNGSHVCILKKNCFISASLTITIADCGTSISARKVGGDCADNCSGTANPNSVTLTSVVQTCAANNGSNGTPINLYYGCCTPSGSQGAVRLHVWCNKCTGYSCD